MNDKIDGIFEYKSYRYVPYDLRNDWKTFYNLTSKKFYNKLNSHYNLFPYINIDLHNEELEKIDNLVKLCSDFEIKVDNLKPKIESDLEYSMQIKDSLKTSLKEMNEFLDIKRKILMNHVTEKKMPLKENSIEHFKTNTCNSIENVNDRRSLIIFSLLFIILFYIFI